MVLEGDSMLSRNIGSQTQVPACSSACTSTSRSELSKIGARCACHRDVRLRRSVSDVVIALCKRHDTIGDLPSVQASTKGAADVLRHMVDEETLRLVDVQRHRPLVDIESELHAGRNRARVRPGDRAWPCTDSRPR